MDPDPETGNDSQGNSLKTVLAFSHPAFPLSLNLSLPPGSHAPSNCELQRSEAAKKASLPCSRRRSPRALTRRPSHKRQCAREHAERERSRSQISKFIDFLSARNNKVKQMKLALRCKIRPEMQKRYHMTNYQSHAFLRNTQHPASSLPGEENTNNKKKCCCFPATSSCASLQPIRQFMIK